MESVFAHCVCPALSLIETMLFRTAMLQIVCAAQYMSVTANEVADS